MSITLRVFLAVVVRTSLSECCYIELVKCMRVMVSLSAIQTALRLSADGRVSLHEELKVQRRELREERERRRALRAEETRRLRELQGERQEQLAELELLKEAQRQAQVSLQQEETRRRSQHEELQKTLQRQLQEAQEVNANPSERIRECALLTTCSNG